MSVSNIDKFNDLTGKVFDELYTHFPMPCDLIAAQLMAPVPTAAGSDDCELELADHDAQFFLATVRWLIGSGFMNGEVIPTAQVTGAVLTVKGFEALKAMPHCLTHGHSIRERIAETMKEGSKETLKSLVAEEIAIGAKLITPVIEII
ncbi:MULTISPECIES: hypothetical protein [unclassified Pseudomonas]|uniref:hypothetical protein n=1 Tax=unclassified Pseudomonas TaxID=196821 RepID=UPI0014750F63|nr:MULTISPECIES: hypothetical protein [unclassified Pseudomonas]NMY38192.1 hypothetical protein [Pseudomonas sp. WS 5078]NMY61108.1 hypothetical protein [Pseudomonas sp. WS 5354]